MDPARMIASLTHSGPVLTDGAWGTELQARGLGGGETPDLWNLSHPDRVEQVARAYVEAGSRIILTNTFRANRIALGAQLHGASLADINRAGAEISRRAAGVGKALVFASIGPSGKMLIARQITEEVLIATFTEQVQALAAAKADGLVVETMSDLSEACIAVRVAVAIGLPVVACMAFDSGKSKDRTMTGVTPQQAAEELTRAGAHVVGANCGVGIEQSVAICQAMASATDRPIWIKPNAGIPELVDDKVVYLTDPETFASHVPKLVEAGASFIGGCCGTSPRYIAAVRARLAAR